MAGRVFLLLTAFWGLVLMPSLCTAGLLRECCAQTPGSLPGPGDTCVSRAAQGCSDDCPDRPSNQVPQRRDCGPCADVCNAMVHAQPDVSRLCIAAMQVHAMHAAKLTDAVPVTLPSHNLFLRQDVLTISHPGIDTTLPLLI